MVALVIAVMLMRPAQPATTSATQPPVPARAKSSRVAGEAQTPGAIAPVKLKALGETREEPGDQKRNPFRFQPKAPPPPPPQPKVIAPPPSTIEPPRTGPPPPPPVPPISLKFIGVLERANGVKWAVLSDGKSAPMYGKEGDIIDGRYQIVKIGTESIDMTYVDGRGRTVIRLTGQ